MQRERFQAVEGARGEDREVSCGPSLASGSLRRADPACRLGLASLAAVATLLLALVPLTIHADEAAPVEATAASANAASADGATTAPWPAHAPTETPSSTDDSDAGAPGSVSGSITSRATLELGGADRLSTRLALEWTLGSWAGGFTADLDNSRSGTVWRPDDVGSLAIPERWVAWHRAGPRPMEVRLGTAYGLRFGEGLVLGAASFEGVQLTLEPTKRTRYIALLGTTDAIDPDDLRDEPITLFPDQTQLGTKGRLAGLRAEVHPTDELSLGFNLLGAEGSGPKAARAGLASVDTAWSHGMVDLSAELAARDDGGSGLFVRTTLSKSETWGVSFEGRRYDHFLSPVGSAPSYSGLSGSNTVDETGGLVRYDFAPTRRISGSFGVDVSEEREKGAGLVHRVDERLAMHFVLSKTTALAWGIEHEVTDDGRDGTIHSLLATTAFRKGGRLAARLQLDLTSEEPRDSLRLSYRLPLCHRRFTLLVDDTVLSEGNRTTNEFEAGGSLKVGEASFLTVRGTVADGPESIDVTWYQRF